MIDPRLLAKIEEFARPYCERAEDPGLWGHVELVRKFALQLAGIEGADPQVVEIAALLHDIGRSLGSDRHSVNSHDLAKVFLKGVDMPESRRELILECVLKHSSRFSADDNRIEVKVIQSADALGTLFDDAWQEYCRRTISREELTQLFARSLSKINLESARQIAQPQIAKLEALLP